MAEAAVGLAGPSRSSVTDVEELSGTTFQDALLAIKRLDRFAFDDGKAREGDVQRPRKIVRVAEIDALQSASPRSRFSDLSGIGSLHRERARRRRSLRSRTDAKDGAASLVHEDVSSTYRPLSLEQLLQRSSTFTVSTYSNKPSEKTLLSPLGMAMNGWLHASGQKRNEVRCTTCSAEWLVETGASEAMVRDKHSEWCPWRIRSCQASLYRVPIRSYLETRKELTAALKGLSSCIGLDLVKIARPKELDLTHLDAEVQSMHVNAVTLALLGWQLTDADAAKDVHNSIIQCHTCARRAGLWVFVQDVCTQRAFDPIREHKEYCPVINGLVQGGRWLGATTRPLSSDNDALPAWQLKLKVLVAKANTPASGQHAVHDDMRNMRSHEIIGKVKSLLDGRS